MLILNVGASGTGKTNFTNNTLRGGKEVMYATNPVGIDKSLSDGCDVVVEALAWLYLRARWVSRAWDVHRGYLKCARTRYTNPRTNG